MAQQQQLQQQRSGVDILIVAADVCDNKEMQRAVNEHMARYGMNLFLFFSDCKVTFSYLHRIEYHALQRDQYAQWHWVLDAQSDMAPALFVRALQKMFQQVVMKLSWAVIMLISGA